MINPSSASMESLQAVVCTDCGMGETSLEERRVCPRAASSIAIVLQGEIEKALAVESDVPAAEPIEFKLSDGSPVIFTKGEVDAVFETAHGALDTSIATCVERRTEYDVSASLYSQTPDFLPAETFTTDQIVQLLKPTNATAQS